MLEGSRHHNPEVLLLTELINVDLYIVVEVSPGLGVLIGIGFDSDGVRTKGSLMTRFSTERVLDKAWQHF